MAKPPPPKGREIFISYERFGGSIMNFKIPIENHLLKLIKLVKTPNNS